MQKNDKYFNSDELIDEVLKTKPGFSLSEDFAEKVTNKVERNFTLHQYLNEFFIYLGAILGIGIIMATMAFIWYRANIQEWLDFLLNNITWVAGINVLIIFILFTDKVLLKYFLHNSQLKKI